MKCAIIASGRMEYNKSIMADIRSCDLIICADGGAGHLRRLNILPHVILGDFDSIAPEDKKHFTDKGVPLTAFPAKKDKTDSELCIDYAIEKKATDITMFGFAGSRLDHTLANIFLLKKLKEKNIPARIIDPHNEICLVTSEIEISGNPGDTVSIIPVTDAVTGVTLEGLAYPLDDVTIKLGSSLGISNRFLSHQARIKIKTGLLLVIQAADE